MSLSRLKKLVPKRLVGAYHFCLAYLSALHYLFPSSRLIVIGVTGTNGKTTTVNLIAAVLEAAGHKVGLTSTANFRVAGRDRLNDLKMTMPGRSFLQRTLSEMVRAGCRYAIVETSSEGIKQHRHSAINYDIAVFTNLTPEHIEAHGSFENYREAKKGFFLHVARGRVKRFRRAKVLKTAIVDIDDKHATYFLDAPFARKIGYTVELRPYQDAPLVSPGSLNDIVKADNVELRADSSAFTVRGARFHIRLPGMFNIDNSLAAIAVGLTQGVPLETAARALEAVTSIPGRMEFIFEGQPFKVLVDYAPEPQSFRKLYQAVGLMEKKRVIHVLGSCGGGRDRDRRPVLGGLAANNADIVIVTNEDPYDDDPKMIMREVAAGAVEAGKAEGRDLFIIEDRAAALQKAVDLAEPGDLVVATGKGAEQAICVAGGAKIPWDERVVLRQLLRKKLGKPGEIG